MINQKRLPYILSWFFLSSCFCIILDLVMFSISKNSATDNVAGFDYAIVEQVIFFSVWVTLANIIWSLINLMNFKNENSFEIKTISKQGFNIMVVFNVVVFLIFAANAIISPKTVLGFNSWWGITKSVIEHYLNPVLFVLFYFLVRTRQIKTKEYLLKDSWWVMVMPIIYLIFIIMRCVFLQQMELTGVGGRNFPYLGLSPYEIGWALASFLGLIFVIAQWGFSILMNFLSNLVINKINNKNPKK